MLPLLLIEGIIIGFLMAVPIGVIGILCIQRTLNGGRRQGYIIGLAGASADLIYSLVSASGIKLISDFITDHNYEMRFAGGILLLLMGVHLIRSPRRSAEKQENASDEARTYFSTVILALTNPLVMFSYAAVLTMVGVARLEYPSLSILLAGIFLGSFLWFVLISNLANRFRTSMTMEKLAIVNPIAGLLLILIGLGAIWAGVQGMG